jgi:hypothetical protein
MLQYGTRITQVGDPLQSIAVERLYHGIRSPKAAFQDRIEQLRALRSLDEQQYRELKKQLPYFVCGIFHPAVRRKEHFASIEYFLLDLDHLDAAGLERAALQERLQEVPELLLGFASPSGDGLKLMFRLDEPCRDAALFSAFYKVFARRFAERHGLMQAIDLRTSDVTRACFLSWDPEAFYRPEARPLAIADFITELDFGKAEKEIRAAEQAIREQQPKPPPGPELSDEALLRIKQKLNPNFRASAPKNHYVPPEVDDAVGALHARLPEYELELVETKPIGYGRMVRVKAGLLWAEINVFYGNKRGFSVVATAKSGSNPDLAKLAAQAIGEILAGSGEGGNGQGNGQ